MTSAPTQTNPRPAPRKIALLLEFTRGFTPDNPYIMSGKVYRWCQAMLAAANNDLAQMKKGRVDWDLLEKANETLLLELKAAAL